ncbi:MaoC family dehydratase [Marinobacter sp.]|uniref:MaoC family dehydratase n=1 Tax=Marinobacter sp. TaxID=50741 RepID=UPI0038502DC8
MQRSTLYQRKAPALLPLYARVLLPKSSSTKGDDHSIPGLSAELTGAQTEIADLDRYRQLCGFPNRTAIPLTWPHILAFPLHLKLLTSAEFPLPLLGLVHLRNRITQHRPIGRGELLDLTVSLGNDVNTEKGLEFDLITSAHSAGKKVWEEASTTLFRRAQGSSQKKSGPRPTLESFPNSLELHAPESIGRKYGRISGDLNPIHMHAVSAKAFGFPRAIAHGMWSKACCLALLSEQPEWRDGPVTVDCQFKRPLLLPGSATLNWQQQKDRWDFQLLDSKGTAPHLTGAVTWDQEPGVS